MPVQSEHPEYKDNVKKWRKCRIASEGEESIKAEGEEFLPRLGGQSQSSYDAYKDRASFYAGTARTIRGISGVVFRKDPIVHGWPENLSFFLYKINKRGSVFPTFAKNVFVRILTAGRYGVLLDWPTNAPANQPPFWAGYSAESIINWKVESIEGEDKLTMVVLKEEMDVTNPSDEFKWDAETRFRVLQLEEGKYAQYVYVEAAGAKREEEKYVMSPEDSIGIVKVRGRPLDFIPFLFFGVDDLGPQVEKPPLLDLVNINISHYRNSADLEHGRHFTALPQPWVAGFKVEEGDSLTIGSEQAWVTENPEAKAGYLEYTGQGLKALEEALRSKEDQMAVLGARMLEEPKRAVEAADTHKTRRSGEESVTAAIARVTSLGLTKLLQWTLQLTSVSASVDDVRGELNTDYVSTEISPQMLQALMVLLQDGRISMDTFFYNLGRGEIIPEGRTLEEEIELIMQNPPISEKVEEEDELGEEEEEEEIE